ncbi:MAG: GNAT family N-acetyltransferase [Chloroflexota bacterium]|jgi:GNAT superfamily N-acetyltransferase|nr:GNAT family N-acetyltransferase [Chloroflexota bacterium]MDP6509012.1 GNAT family N-acetyltransferase [Chloroflexota bacterium]MDP6756841.1 GNAT family N-acetyltransferase [Chloroflexota bacterium]
MRAEEGGASPATIRAAGREDIPQILSLIRELAVYENLADQVVATEDLLSENLFGDAAIAEALLADVDGATVGFALFFQTFSTFLARPGIYLEDLFVKPAHRGRGIGRALFERVAREAHARRCGRLEWSVLDWNEPAIRFYESLGAVALDEWTGYRLTSDAIRRLAEPD